MRFQPMTIRRWIALAAVVGMCCAIVVQAPPRVLGVGLLMVLETVTIGCLIYIATHQKTKLGAVLLLGAFLFVFLFFTVFEIDAAGLRVGKLGGHHRRRAQHQRRVKGSAQRPEPSPSVSPPANR